MLRTQRAAFQEWVTGAPWAAPGQVTVVLAGDLAKKFNLLPTAELRLRQPYVPPICGPRPDAVSPHSVGPPRLDTWIVRPSTRWHRRFATACYKLNSGPASRRASPLRTRSTDLDLAAGATELRTCICGVQGAEPWGESPQTFDYQEELVNDPRNEHVIP